MKKILENIKGHLSDLDMGVYWLIVIITVFCFLIYWDSKQSTPESIAQNQHNLKCISKTSGSQPECWDQADWAAFCENTNICKNATVK